MNMGSLFKKPEPPKPVAMPDSEGPQVREAEARRRRTIAAQSGRRSTVLSQGQGEAGTGAYRASVLGNAG
jgi:hypothetical protein